MPSIYNKYTHMHCECGGLIDSWDRNEFSCDKCHREYKLHTLDYDVVFLNAETGCKFPMKRKEK